MAGGNKQNKNKQAKTVKKVNRNVINSILNWFFSLVVVVVVDQKGVLNVLFFVVDRILRKNHKRNPTQHHVVHVVHGYWALSSYWAQLAVCWPSIHSAMVASLKNRLPVNSWRIRVHCRTLKLPGSRHCRPVPEAFNGPKWMCRFMRIKRASYSDRTENFWKTQASLDGIQRKKDMPHHWIMSHQKHQLFPHS